MKKGYLHITIISTIIGFMLAVQYNTVQNTEKVETTDIWEIRQQLSEEKKQYSELLEEIRKANAIVRQYEEEEISNPELILAETVEGLRKQIGIETVEGPGLEIEITPSEEAITLGYEINEIPPLLLIRLVNDIYRYNGKYIEIDGQRLGIYSAIRDINGRTTINGVAINKDNCVIKIVGQAEEDVQKLYNYLLSSTFMDEFYIDNLSLKINEPQSLVSVKGSDFNVITDHLQEVKGE